MLKKSINKFSRRQKFLIFLQIICLLFSFSGIFYSYFTGLSIYQLAIDVEYQDETQTFVVMNIPHATAGFELGLKVGDHIVAFDGQKLPVFFGNNQHRYRLWEASAEYPPLLFPKKLHEWPFPSQQKMFLYSLEAHSLTIVAARFTMDNSGNPKTILIEDDLINKSNASLLTVQLVLALAFWATGFVLTLLRPHLFMTFCFNLFFCFVGAYLLATTVTSFYLDHLIFTLLVLSSLVCPISFFYFVLLFPDGKPPTRWLRLLSLFLLAIMVTANGLYLFFSLYQKQFTLPEGTLEILYSIRLKFFSVLSFAALIIITLRSFRARGLQRAKFKLVTVVLLVAAFPPLFFFSSYVFWGLWEELVVIYFGLLCLPTVLIPIVMVYAIVRHQLFYPDDLVRSFLSYLLLSLLLSALYFMFATAISFALEKLFAIRNEEFNFLAFVIIALTASRFRVFTQAAVDRIFYRHKLDYVQLLRDWNNKLIFFKDGPGHLFHEITSSLKDAFSYHDLGVFLFIPERDEFYNPTNLFYFHNKPSAGRIEAREKNSFFPPLIISSAKPEAHISTMSQSSETAVTQNLELPKPFDRLLDYSQLTSLGLQLTELVAEQADPDELFLSTAVPSPLYLPTSPHPLAARLSALGYNFYLPFPSQSSIAGGLLLGDKLSGQTPSLEELDWMLTLARQVSQALHTAILVETETVRRHLMQTFFLDQDTAGQRERQRIARDLHDTVVQELGYLDKSITDWYLAQQEQNTGQSPTTNGLSSTGYSSVLSSRVGPHSDSVSRPGIPISSNHTLAFMGQVLEINRSVLTQLRGLINQLRPRSIDLGLVVALRRLFSELNQLHRDIVFEFELDLTLEQETYLTHFSADQTWHIYQIINEAINNGIKHGGGSSIYLKLRQEVKIEQPDKQLTFLIVEILDDGKGFPAPLSLSDLFDQGHFGLVFMQERVNALGGLLSFTRETIDEVYGSLVRAVIPVPENVPDKSQEKRFYDPI